MTAQDKWKRPNCVEFPSTWMQFQGKSGRNYWIQDVTDEYRQDVVHYMTHKFILDEPLDRYSKYPADEAYLEEMQKYWQETLDQRLGLVCLTEVEGAAGQKKTVVAGMNCTCRKYKIQDTDDQEQTQTSPTASATRTREFMAVIQFMTSQRDVFETFGITEYLGALGLYVPPEFRGDGVGLHLIKARENLCKAMGFPASFTIFTSTASQKLAEKAGFQDCYSLTYDELAKKDEEFRFPGINENTERIRFMYKLYK